MLTQKYRFKLETPDEVIFDLCYQLKRQKKFDESISLFNTLLERYPNSTRGHFFLGETYREKGDLEKAKECYKRTLEVSPDFQAAKRKLEMLENEKNVI